MYASGVTRAAVARPRSVSSARSAGSSRRLTASATRTASVGRNKYGSIAELFSRSWNIGCDDRTAQSKRLEWREILRAEEAHVRQRVSVLIQGDDVLRLDEAEKVDELRDSHALHERLDVVELALVRADEHELVRRTAVPCERRDGLEQRRVILVRPELSRVEDVPVADAEGVDPCTW